MPQLNWAKLAEDPAVELVRFLGAIAGSPAVFRSWLNAATGLFTTADKQVIGGSGTRPDPWTLPLVFTTEGQIQLRIAAEPKPDGVLTIDLGLHIASKPVDSKLAALAFTFEASAETRVEISAVGTAEVGAGEIGWLVSARNSAEGIPLFSVAELPGGRFQIGSLQVGKIAQQDFIAPYASADLANLLLMRPL